MGEVQPIQTSQTPTVQTLNPDTVTAQTVKPIRKDLKVVTVTQVDKSGVLINRFATKLNNFGYVTSIIPPRAIVSEEANVDWMALDVGITTNT